MIGLTSEVGASLGQAAAVWLESHGHVPGVPLAVTGTVIATHPITWHPCDDQVLRTWSNGNVATEAGAAGIAILIFRSTGYTVTRRAAHGTGFDYWFDRNNDDHSLPARIRVEVSGMRTGSDAEFAKRLREKVAQMRRGQAAQSRPGKAVPPGSAIVVDFGSPRAKVVPS